MNKKKVLFVLILILSVFLRFYKISTVPTGLYSDEAAYGYNAYSILLTGKDEYGTHFPLAFKSFGDYKTPLYIYFMVPFVRVFGLTIEAVRYSSVFLGLALIVIVYLLSGRMFQRSSVSLLSAFFVSVFPFGLQFNRMAHENNLSVVLLSLGVLLFLHSFEYKKLIILSFIAFAMSMYAYHDTRVIVPCLLASLLIIFRSQLYDMKKQIGVAVVSGIILLLPFVDIVRSPDFWSRPSFTAVTTDAGMRNEINQERGEDKLYGFLLPAFFHNKPLSYAFTFLDNYFKHFSADFFFFRGDTVTIYRTLGNGVLYIAVLPFLVFGAYFLVRKKSVYNQVIIAWMIISPIPAALTRFVPSASRTLSLLPILSIIVAIGIVSLIDNKKYSNINRVIYLLITVVISFNVAYYLHMYYFNSPVRYAKDWHFGMQTVINEVVNLQSKYKQVWFSRNAWGYIYPLFYMKYPPSEYQKEAKLSNLNEYGFGWVDGFGKYKFGDFPPKFENMRDTLFVGTPNDFPKLNNAIYTEYYPDKSKAFILADYDSLHTK
ncbi:MAG: glycosyltransferase family 39 protein [Patescibacteria group bacterium]|nr:glycosyltransferase family 39 protein [Patescibacteria group bacterium]